MQPPVKSTPPNPVYTRFFTDLQNLKRNWGWFMFLGIALIALGVVAIGASTLVTVASMIFLGALLLSGGILQVIYAFWAQKWSGFFLALLAGILYTVTGFLLFMHPAAGALSLTLLLAGFYMIGGLFRIVGALTTQFDQWGWALFSGIVMLILGLLIWQGWPATGLWIFGLFIGIDLIFYGWFWVALALGARNAPTPPDFH